MIETDRVTRSTVSRGNIRVKTFPFAFTSWSWSLLPFEKVTQITKLLGFRHIDLGAFTGWAHYDADALAADPAGMANLILQHTQSSGLALSDLFVTFGPGLIEHCVNDPDPVHRSSNRETLRRVADFCIAAGIPGVTLCPGVEQPTLGRENSFDLACEALSDLVAIGRDAGLAISVEPHIESIAESPDDAFRLLERVKGLSLTLDYAHFVCQGYPQDQIEPLLRHTRHFHARQARRHQNQCRTREGEIDFLRILSLLSEQDYSGAIAFEYVWEQWQDNDQVDVVSETLMLSRQLSTYQSEGD
ncbi:MAG: sugar phosphate isomerase/epimerase [Phycisphaeraceae bacterium]|nr:sugar phosphate isomerase/epimerase [Phycisphaeraceae bacterium]